MNRIHPNYPTEKEIDAWVADLWETSEKLPSTATPLPDNGIRIRFGCFYMDRSQFIKFEIPGMDPFYGMFTPAIGDKRPLIVHTPGYGAELSFHPDIAQENYNLLELSPLGYWTPDGDREDLYFPEPYDFMPRWPVLPNTAKDAKAMNGYFGWLLDCICAVRWAMSLPSVLPDRVSFFGTSQGGGASLLLGSVFAGRGTHCVCADEPFLTNYPLADLRGAYSVLQFVKKTLPEEVFFRNLGYADTVSHIHRMNYPVLITVGTKDEACLPDTVRSLFDSLDTTKMLYSMKDRWHGYQYEFDTLVRAWLKLYA